MPFSPSDFLRHKQLLPSDLRTAEWDIATHSSPATAAWVKERAFFMASVANAAHLQAFRDAAAAVAAGTMSPGEARRHVRQLLKQARYKPAAGLEDTVKDLTSEQRLKVSIDTNVALARGWAQHAQSMQNTERPAQELYRAGTSKKPRDWQTRWKQAAQGLVDVARDGSMVALKTSPIWARLSRFGNPYPPFDFNSKMRVRSVSLERARQLGLIPTREEDPQAAQQQAALQRSKIPSLNERVEVPMQGVCDALAAQLQQLLQGIAEWDPASRTLRMTDMNGTRPYPWDQIAPVISAPNPVAGNLQLDAWQLWTQDSSLFRRVALGEKIPGISLDTVEDCARLFQRIEPTTSQEGGEVHRALGFSNQKKFMEALESLTAIGRDDNGHLQDATYYTARKGTIAESWTNNPRAIPLFANKKYNIILHCKKYRSRRRIDGLYGAAEHLKQYQGGSISREGESVFLGNARFRLLSRNPKITRHKNGTEDYEFDVEEA